MVSRRSRGDLAGHHALVRAVDELDPQRVAVLRVPTQLGIADIGDTADRLEHRRHVEPIPAVGRGPARGSAGRCDPRQLNRLGDRRGSRVAQRIVSGQLHVGHVRLAGHPLRQVGSVDGGFGW